jgi:outer membrane protein
MKHAQTTDRSGGACTRRPTSCSTAEALLKAGLLSALLLTLIYLFAPTPVSAAPLRLTPEQAVARALANNLDLAVARQSVALSKAPEQAAAAAFEPALFADASVSRSPGQISRQRAGLAPVGSTTVGGSVGVRKAFSTGTSVEATLSSSGLSGGGSLDPSFQSSATLTARQSLLNGVSRSANEIGLTQARLNKKAAQLALQRKAELIARDTLAAYFELHAALAQDEIQKLAVQNAQRTLTTTKALIEAGKLAPAEALAARYAVAQQQRARLSTERAVADGRDKLARLIGAVSPTSLATPELTTVAAHSRAPKANTLEALAAKALQARDDLRAADQTIALARAKVAAAAHQRLPTLDLVGSVFVTGLSGSASDPTLAASIPSGYLASYEMDQLGWSVGLSFAIPLGNRTAKAALTSAEIELRRAMLAKQRLQQTISREINSAWRAVQLAQDQLALSQQAQQVAKAKLDAEQARYDAGKSTAHVLAAVQAEVLSEKLTRVRAAADLSKALAELHTVCGDLLQQMRLATSGGARRSRRG